MNLYGSKYARAILEEIELLLQVKSKRVMLESCSIERVMPQSITDDSDGKAWQADLGEQWRDVHSTWLHTPGNLTLVGSDYNISMQKKPFTNKQPTLAASVVYLNKHFAKFPQIDVSPAKWTEATIKARGLELAQIAANLWAGPT